MGDVLLSNGIILFMVLIAILVAIYFYCRKSLSYFADEKGPKLEIIILVKNTQDEIEGTVRNYYQSQIKPIELWIVDCGSEDQTPEILQRLSSRFLGLKLLFLPDLPLEMCIQEVLKHTNAPALLLIDGTYLKSKEVLELTALLHVKKNVVIGLKSYEK